MYDCRNTQPLTQEQRALVEANLGCVGWFLRAHNDIIRTFGYDDAFQTGCLGLMKAARNYDESRGKFSTLAMIEIRNAIFTTIREGKAAKRAPRSGNILSMEANVVATKHASEPTTVQDTIADPGLSPEDAYIHNEMLAIAREILESDDLLRAFYADNKKQLEIAAEIGATQSWVSRLIRQRLASARTRIGSN